MICYQNVGKARIYVTSSPCSARGVDGKLATSVSTLFPHSRLPRLRREASGLLNIDVTNTARATTITTKSHHLSALLLSRSAVSLMTSMSSLPVCNVTNELARLIPPSVSLGNTQIMLYISHHPDVPEQKMRLNNEIKNHHQF